MAGKYIDFRPFFIKSHRSDNEEDKEELIEFEAMAIDVSDSSGDGDVARITFMRGCRNYTQRVFPKISPKV